MRERAHISDAAAARRDREYAWDQFIGFWQGLQVYALAALIVGVIWFSGWSHSIDSASRNGRVYYPALPVPERVLAARKAAAAGMSQAVSADRTKVASTVDDE